MIDPLLARGIRVAVVLPVVLIVLHGVLDLGSASLLGVFAITGLLVLGDFRGPPVPRAVTLAAVSLGGAVMLVLGALASQHEVTAVAGAAAAGFVLLLVGVYRGQFGKAGIPLLLPFLSEAANPVAMQSLPVSLEAWLVGAAIACAGALVILPGYERDVAHPHFAAAAGAYADLVPTLWPEVTAEADAAYARFVEALESLDDRWQGDRSRPSGVLSRDRGFISVLDYLHQLQALCLTRLQTGAVSPSADPALGAAVAATARSVSDSMLSGRPTVTLSGLVGIRGRQWDEMTGEFAGAVDARDPALVREVGSRNFLLRLASLLTVAMGVQTELALGGKPRTELLQSGAVAIPVWRSTPLRLLAQQLQPSSPWFRNAARGAVALAIAIAIARLPHIAHGFWIVMGALGALRFDAMGTGRTVKAAVIGQTVGFLVSFLLAWTLRPHPVVLALLVPVAGFAAGYAPPRRLWLPQAAFTILIITCATLLTPQDRAVPLTRFEDVLIGLGVSLVVSLLLWPRGIQAHVAGRLNAAAAAVAQLLIVSNRRLLGEAPESAMQSVSDEVRLRLRDAAEAVDLAALEQPPQPPPTLSWSRLVMSGRHLMFGCAVQGNAPAVPVSVTVRNPMEQAASSTAARYVAATESLLVALSQRPGVDPGLSSPTSALTEGPRADVRRLIHQAETAAVAEAAPDADGVAMVQTVEWAGDWLQHVELVSGRLENRRQRVLATADPVPD